MSLLSVVVGLAIGILLGNVCRVDDKEETPFSKAPNRTTMFKCARVAVYEHVPLGKYDDSQSPSEIINLNLEEYTKAVKLAAEEVTRQVLSSFPMP